MRLREVGTNLTVRWIDERNGSKIVIAGVSDLSAVGTGNPAPDLEAALKRAPPGAPVILLDHQPKNAREAAARGVALQLAASARSRLVSPFRKHLPSSR